MARAADGDYLLEVGDVEIAHAPGADLALRAKLLEGRDRVFERVSSAPMKEIAVQSVGLQPSE